MAINWTEAEIEKVIRSVLSGLGGERAEELSATSTDYNGRALIGVYTDMEEAIEAAGRGYKAIRAMSLAEREKIISAGTLYHIHPLYRWV